MEEKELVNEETSVSEDPSLKKDEEKNKNVFIKGLKSFWKYLVDVFLNFKESFKYNNMKLPALLVAIPGLLLGFFLNFHYYVVVQLSFSIGDVNYPGMPFDYSAIVLFALMLFGILNIFSAVSMSGKKNKKSVILATILSAIIFLFGLAYLYAVIYFLILVYSGEVALPDFAFDINYVMCFVSVIGSMVLSIVGCVLGWLRYDRNYVEVDR